MADTIHPLIRLKEKFPGETFITVTGYLGTSSNKSSIRLYHDLSAQVAYEIPADAVVHREEVKECDCNGTDTSEVPAMRLYLKASAQVTGSFTKSAKDLFGPPPKAPSRSPLPPLTVQPGLTPPLVFLTSKERCQRQLCKEIRQGMNQQDALNRFTACLNRLGITDPRLIRNLADDALWDCGLLKIPDNEEDTDICGVPGFPPCYPGFP